MNKTISKINSLLVVIIFLCLSCYPTKKGPTTNHQITKDTLNLGYMYWANDMTPFGFESQYSLILRGTVTQINTPKKTHEDALYTSVNGHIAIQEIILDSKSHDIDMTNVSFIETDCFDGTSLTKGDHVLVFCVSYEGAYAITGRQSIIKILANDKRYVTSLKKYIKSSYNPTVIEQDIDLWNAVSAGEALKEYIKTTENITTTKTPIRTQAFRLP
ncbi:hypothetical protein ACFO3O_13465 [Dokdonia ponticola]|uniref:DUF4369 domain-containing protein n=1 Tax=Dokdonia ponticola TaxID=2041041 RepID=A0ABV9HZE7_9FLAO